MDIVIDTSALISVIAGEPERDEILRITSGQTLIGPGSIPWEIGNAFSAMFKQHRLSIDQAARGIDIFHLIPIRYIEIDFHRVLMISEQAGLYAYDAYFLDCALRCHAPLLTLDRKLKNAASQYNVSLLEV